MNLGWKIASTVALAGSAFIAQKVVEIGWKAVTRTDVPGANKDEESPLLPLIAFATISAMAATVAERYAMRGARKWAAPRFLDDLVED